MSRTILIGNSHTAALKAAWDDGAGKFPGEEVIFFAAPGLTFRLLRLSGDRVFGLSREAAAADAASRDTVERINGRMNIDLTSGDAVVWAGYQWPQHTIAKLLAGFDIDGLREIGAARRLSRPAFDALIDELAADILPGPEWRGWPAPPLAIALKPLPSALITRNRPKGPWATLAKRPEGTPEAFAIFFARLAARLGEMGIELVTPPQAALLPSCLTRAEFSRDSRRLRHDEPHPDTDSTHMNSQYGALWFEHYFATRRSRSRPEPVALCS